MVQVLPIFAICVVISAAATIDHPKTSDLQANSPFPGVVNCRAGIGCCLPKDFDPNSPEHVNHPLNQNRIVKRVLTTITEYFTSYATIDETDTTTVEVTQTAVTTSSVQVTETETVSQTQTVFVTITSTQLTTATAFTTLGLALVLPTPTPPPPQSSPVFERPGKADPILAKRGYLDSWD